MEMIQTHYACRLVYSDLFFEDLFTDGGLFVKWVQDIFFSKKKTLG